MVSGDSFLICVTFFLTLNPFLSLRPVPVAFDTWSRRVHFKNSDPILDSSLVITSTDMADEGGYLCRISTFPLGNFDMGMSIIVWSKFLSLCVLLRHNGKCTGWVTVMWPMSINVNYCIMDQRCKDKNSKLIQMTKTVNRSKYGRIAI